MFRDVRWHWVTFDGNLGDLLIVVTLCGQLTSDLLPIHKNINNTRSALGWAHLPPTTVFRRLKTTRCYFDGSPIPVHAWDFPDVIKFHVAALQCIRYGRKESGSVIRTMILIGLKSQSVRQCPDICRHGTFHPNPCTRFWVILHTDKQTNAGARGKTYILRCRR